jgi:ferredoxin-type protein NapH
MIKQHSIGSEAIAAKGWVKAHQWLILRRSSQIFIMMLFLLGPWFGLWLVKGNLSSSLTLDFLPLTDPYILLQSLVAGHALSNTAIMGAIIVFAVYALVGGRVYCSFVCPVNIITDFAHWLGEKFDISKGWQPKREIRLWLLGATLVVSMITGTVAWEFLNPVSITHRGIIFGFGFGWTIIAAVFIFDLFISRRGWCGHICPVGAFYGLVGSYSQIRVAAVNRAACNDCMDCFAVCPEPHVITPALRGDGTIDTPLIASRDCTNCGRCIDVCAQDVFAFGHRLVTTPMSGHGNNSQLTNGRTV